MNDLYLLRHGIAVPHGTPGMSDDERPLTSRGEKRVRQIGQGLRRLGIKLDRIVTSPLPRASKTAEIVADVLGLTDILETDEALRADRPAESIRDWVFARPEARLMVVGHNPGLADLLGLLLGGLPPGAFELRKGGVAALAARPEGGLNLDWMARPRLLRRLAD